MSRIGRAPILVPAGVEIEIGDDNVASVKGPNGSLQSALHREMVIEINENIITVKRPSDSKKHKSLHGLTRTLLFNMVEGVTNGFVKELEVNGVGYRASLQGTVLVMLLGYSHPVKFFPVPGVTFLVSNQNLIVVKGADKQLVGQIAAKIRKCRPVEPYKGKGISVVGEQIRRKVGKSGAKKKS